MKPTNSYSLTKKSLAWQLWLLYCDKYNNLLSINHLKPPKIEHLMMEAVKWENGEERQKFGLFLKNIFYVST